MVWTFVRVAFLLTLSPGPAFALVVRTALAADARSARAKRAFVRSALARRIEQLTGAALVGLGLRLAVEKS